MGTVNNQGSNSECRRPKLVAVLLVVGAVIVVAAGLTLVVPTTVVYDFTFLRDTVVDVPYSYQVVNSSAKTTLTLASGAVAEAVVRLENTDKEPGAFTVLFTFTTLNNVYRDQAIVYVFPGEAKSATGRADISLGEDWKWTYDVAPPTRGVTRTVPSTVTCYHRMSVFRQLLGLYERGNCPEVNAIRGHH
jgi:hypothetical protein